MRHILVGTDGGESALVAEERALELAEATGATLHLVMVFQEGDDHLVTAGSRTGNHRGLEAAKNHLRAHAASFDTKAEIDCHVVLGSPAKAILKEADAVNADLIVVGNQRVQGVSRMLGSIASDVLKNASCDVLVAKTS